MTVFIATHWAEGAVTSTFRALAEELARRGHTAVRVLSGGSAKHALENHLGNPAVWAWPSRRAVTWKDAVFFWRLARRYRPDCVISNFGASNVMMVVGAFAGVRRRVDWYHTMSTAVDLESEQSRLHRWLLRYRKSLVYRMATHLVPVSGAASEDLQRTFGVSAEKCTVFFNSLPDPLSAMTSTPEADHNRLVCAGRLSYAKGPDVLIRAVAMLVSTFPDLRVTFAGGGAIEGELRQLAENLKVSDHCEFVGVVPRGRILEYMQRSVATIVPSRSEAFGLVNIESLAVGTPVVASRVGGIPEIVRDGVEGFLVPAGDASALADGIRKLLSDADLSRRMRARARERFISQYEQSALVCRQADWLEEIAGYRSGSADGSKAGKRANARPIEGTA